MVSLGWGRPWRWKGGELGRRWAAGYPGKAARGTSDGYRKACCDDLTAVAWKVVDGNPKDSSLS